MQKFARAIVTAALLTIGTNVMAVPLPNFTDTLLPGTTVAARPELAGTVIADRLVDYSFADGSGGIASGQVQQRVVRSTSDGTLDFYWRVIGSDEPRGVTALRLIGFDGFVTDGDWRIDGVGTQAPLLARTFGGDAVNFLFGDGGISDRSSSFFFLKTSATRFADTGLYDLLCADSGCVSEAFSTYAPSGAVPEPAQWALLLGGFVLVGATVRRRRAGYLTA